MDKKASDYITCDFRYYQGDVPDEMLEILKQVWPEAYEAYNNGDDISLCFELDYKFKAEGHLAKLSPFFNLAKGYSFSTSTSNGQRSPITALFEAIHLHIGKKSK